MPKTRKQNDFSLATVLTAQFTVKPPKGIVSSVTVPFQEVAMLRRFRECTPFQDLDTFVRAVVKDGLSWLRRMTNGPEQFQIDTMDYWVYDPASQSVTLRNPSKDLRAYEVTYCMKFTKENIQHHNEQLGLILNSLWYKTHATPLAIVELIALSDLLFTQHHNGTSPAIASGVSKVNISQTKV